MVQIHIINLKDAERRRTFMIRQMKELGLRYEFFDAIKGSSLSDDELSVKVDMNEVAKYPNWLTRNSLGCTLSHLGVYTRIVNSGNAWHLVLEDDVVLDKEIIEIIKHVEQNENRYQGHIILFYAIAVNGFVELSKNPFDAVKQYQFHKIISKNDIGGAGAYIIHRETAQKIIDANTPVRVINDTWDYFRDKGAIKQIDCLYPFAAKPAMFESTIGYVDQRSLRYKIKNFVERYKIPVLYYFLRRNREKVWNKTSNINFK